MRRRSGRRKKSQFFNSIFNFILTIHNPSNGTFSWNLWRLSYHHSWVTSSEKSGYAVRPGHTWRKRGRILFLIHPWCFLFTAKNREAWDNLSHLTFPMSVCPLASLIKTSLLSPSSYGQYEPSGCELLIPGSCRSRHNCHTNTPNHTQHTWKQIQTPVYQDHDVALVMSVQVLDQIGQRAELCRVKSEVQKLVHVVDVVPLDVLRTNTNNYFNKRMIKKTDWRAHNQTKVHFTWGIPLFLKLLTTSQVESLVL